MFQPCEKVTVHSRLWISDEKMFWMDFYCVTEPTGIFGATNKKKDSEIGF